mmetsp:Transcript_22772/g.56814  ORF Transcript_22772/g.56814 Transcript_22772/m.56814 type:complete len:129 (-) Transcript_22772:111-497(-)
MVIRHGHGMIRGSGQYQEHMVKVNKRSFAIASNDALSLEPYERVITLKDGTTKTKTVTRTSTAAYQQMKSICMCTGAWSEQRSGVRKIAKRQETAGEAHQWAAKKAEPTFDFVGAAEAAKAARAAPPQ